MSEAYIVDAVRTPVGRRDGTLSTVHPVQLGAHVLTGLVTRNQIDAERIERVIFGCVDQLGEQAVNIARNAAIAAGFPESVPGTTVDFQCGSSQEAINMAAALIQAGLCDLVIAGGVESMSRIPLLCNRELGPGSPYTPAILERNFETELGMAGEKLARAYGITREQADSYAVESQRRAGKARDAGWFDKEILPVEVELEGIPQTITQDGGIRADTSLEKLASLKTVFLEDGILTAGNSSQISDGAAALLVASARALDQYGLKPLARVGPQLVVGSDVSLMLTGPIDATRMILARTGLSLRDIDRIEVNEAFAPVPLAWEKALEPDMDKVNVNGGAIALGHPLGATGARLITTLVHDLARNNLERGLVTMCCGGGMGTATIFERA